MPFKINVNTTEVVELTRKLEKLNRSAFPVAVRQTLNTQAFETKKTELPKEFNKTFDVRSPGFVRAFSAVEMAKGFDVKKMMAKVGMTDRKRGGSSEQAGRDMEQQQLGGTIGGRKFIPIDESRVSKNPKKKIKKGLRLSDISGATVVDSSTNKARTGKQRYVRTAIYAANRYGSGVYVSHKGDNGRSTLYRIDKVGSDIKTRKLFIGVTPVYSIEEGRTVSVSGKPFTLRAATKINRNVERIFEKHANVQFKKALR